MPNNRSQELVTFAHLQMATEAFLDNFDINTERDRLIQALVRGNERASAFPTVLAENFADTFEVIAHKENTSTGFSGTLFRSKITDLSRGLVAGEYTLALRSTEFVDDAVRDGTGTNDLEIRQIGWALGQIADMEAWYKELRAAGTLDANNGLPPGSPFNVTGYSLGGHLATAFAILRRDEAKGAGVPSLIKHTYTFNGAGVGGTRFGQELGAIVENFDRERRQAVGTVALTRDSDIGSALDRVNAIFSEFQRLSTFTDKARTFLNGQVPPLGDLGNGAYQLAAVLASRWTIPSANFGNPLGSVNLLPLSRVFARTTAFENMTEVFGAEGGESGTSLVDGRFSFVAFSGQHYSKPENSFGVYIEDQPLERGNYSIARDRGRLLEDPNIDNFADTHSLVLLVDSLALMSAMTRLDPNLTQSQIEAIFKAASNSKATSIRGTQGQAEGDTLERVLDSFRRIFLGPGVPSTIAPLEGNTWHDLDNRQIFHQRINEFVSNPRFEAFAGQATVKLLPSTASDIEAAARSDIAYRYALRELNPFAITGAPGLYDDYNRNGELHLFDLATGQGAFTTQYLADRAAMLAARMDMAVRNSGFSAGGTGTPSVLYDDAGSAQRAFVFDSATAIDYARPWDGRPYAQREAEMQRLFDRQLQKDKGRKILFGRDADPSTPDADPDTRPGGRDELLGGGLDDHLYGGGGNDTLLGGLGDDRLEGGVGGDVLRGGPSSGSLPFGSTDNDTLLGGAGNDVLAGGLGNDKYYFYTGSGGDTVFDAAETVGSSRRQVGEIYFGDVHIVGRFYTVDPDKKNFTFNGPDGLYRAAYLGDVNTATPGQLVLWKDTDGSNVVTLTNFISGDFGIDLDTNAPPRQYTDKVGTDGADNTNLVDVPHGSSLASDSPDQRVFGLGGADYIQVSHANAQGYGGEGNDYLSNGLADQQLYGEAGRDVLVASAGDDSLYGGLDDDALQGGADKDYLEGNEGNDVLDGGEGEDVIRGGDGNDFIFGGGSVTVAISDWNAFADNSFDWGAFDAAGNVLLRGLVGYSNVEGDALDVIDGGAGIDWIFAGDGADSVSGGTENDYLVGQAGDDSVSGDEGDDLLYGDGAEGDLAAAPGEFAVFTHPQAHGKDSLSGGSGNDFISGDGEADDLYGGEGDDALVGDSANVPEEFHGADYLDGGDGNDVLLGYGKDDTLFGGAGDDNLGGDASTIADVLHGDDTLDGEDGADTLHGDGGDDTLFGGAGNDVLDGDASNVAFEYHGDDYLDGEDGDDALQGGGGADRLFGGAGKDSLVGDGPTVPIFNSGDDYLDGEAGDDVLEGGEGDDTLVGGSGSDILRGGAGDDVYILAAGGYREYIEDQDGVNTIRFPAGVSATSIRPFQALDTDGHAYLGLGYASSDSVYVKDGLTSGAFRYEFADGTVQTSWPLPSSRLVSVYGTAGDDVLSGDSLGNWYYGSAGNDTILFGRGSGADVADGFGQVDRAYFGLDKILVAPGVTLADLAARRDLSGHLTITIRDTGDSIRITYWTNSASLAHRGAQVVFADGTGLTHDGLVALALAPTDGDDVLVGGDGSDSISGGAGDDVIFGDNPSNPRFENPDALFGDEGNDRLDGGPGNDTLDGGPGDDELRGGGGANTYLFGLGDGNDVIIADGSSHGNVVELKPGVTPEDVTLTQGSIVLTLNATGETLTIGSWYTDGGALAAPHFAVDAIRFADGTEWNPSLINERANHATPFADLLRGIGTGDALDGRAGDDRLEGYAGDDVLAGGDGNDTLEGGEGADDLAGGAGDDSLRGGGGNDIYVGGAGDDVLWGGTGDDVYVFESGSGFDLLLDESASSAGEGNWDTVLFGARVGPADVRVTVDQNALVLDYGTGRVRLPRLGVENDLRSHGIEEVRFADGASWTRDELALRASAPPGTEANDVIPGTDGADTIDALGGDDRIEGRLGADVIIGGDGADTLFAYKSSVLTNEPAGDGAANRLLGGGGNDSLLGSTGDDFLDGGPGDDTLLDGEGNNSLHGGEGVDTLTGGGGEDFLDGGPGNDILRGGYGSDRYRFGRASGYDTIEETFIDPLIAPLAAFSRQGELNVIEVDAGLLPEDLLVARDGNHLRIGTSDEAASVTVPNWFVGLYGPEALAVRFADGTEWDTETLVAQSGSAPWPGLDNTVTGTAGNDALSGGYGNDTYVFGYGSGADTIWEPLNTLDEALNRALAGNHDTIRFAAGVRPEDVRVEFSFSQPTFYLGGSGDSLTVGSWGSTATGRVEFAEFEDGTVWDLGTFWYWRTGTSQGPDVQDFVTGSKRNFAAQFGGSVIMSAHDDTFFGLQNNDSVIDIEGNNTRYGGNGNDSFRTGSGDDMLDGGAGNDSLVPDTGDNVIRFGRGYGTDTLNLSGVAANLGTDTIALGQDVRPEHVRLRRGPNASLVVELAGTPDALIVNGSLRAPNGRDRLRVQFADGSLWDTGEIEARIQTAGLIEGGTGNNTLVGSDGDDVFVGGEGFDTLTGGGGRDTFYFYRGDGTDTIFDDGPRIVLGEGIRPQDVTLTGSNFASLQHDLHIQISAAGGLIVAKNWFPPVHAGTIEFADGTVWDTTYVGSRVPYGFTYDGRGHFYGTAGNDMYTFGSTPDGMGGDAGDDVLSGAEGNDTLFGGTGNDTLDGGTEDDELHGEAGDDRLFGRLGNDRLFGGAGDDLLDSGVDALGYLETDADSLYGGEGDDTLIARLGNDGLFGGTGDDTLDAGEGNDLLEGESGDDILDGGPGDDRLYGGAGSDVYLFGIGSGRDTLLDFDTTGTALDTVRMGPGVAPQDVALTQEGADTVLLLPSGDSLTIRVLGREGYGVERIEFDDGTVWDASELKSRALAVPVRERADVIFGGGGDDALAGLEGDDLIEAGAGDDTLDGGAGDDVLHGGDGNDVLDGGPGFDHLVGGEGADTFVVESDSGSDSIGDFGAGDTLAFGPGIAAADVRIARDVETLYLDVATRGQSIALENWFANGARGTIAFADGTSWDGAFLKASVDALADGDDFFVGTEAAESVAARAGADTVHAGAGDDTVFGGEGSDSLYGEDGNDVLSGEAGFDLLSGGAGDDALDGGADDDALSGDDGDDTLLGGEGFDALAGGAGDDGLDGGIGDDILQGDAGDDVLAGGEGTDSLAGGEGNDALEGGAGDDVLEGGAGDDALEGGAGDDALDGGTGSDTYVFAPGFGFDTLSEPQDVASVETLRFTGILPESVEFSWIGNDFFVEIADSADRIRLRDAGITFVSRPERIEFDDGTVWAQADLYARTSRYGTEANDNLSIGILKALYGLGGDDILNGFSTDNLLDGGDGADRLSGLAGNDRLLGGAGGDTLDGGAGNDFLDGGSGNDSLTGGSGDDTYRFGRGYGDDVILNLDAGLGRRDALVLAEDVSPPDLAVVRSGTHLVLTLAGGPERLRIDNWFNGPEFQLDEVRFADGTVWSAADLEAGIVLPAATDGDDLLFGTSGDDVIDGLAGNDRIEGDAGDDLLFGNAGDDSLFGGAGRDTLDAGPGNDALNGGAGGDLYRFGFGSGFDTISDVDANTANLDAVEIDAQPSEVAVTRDSANVHLTLSGGADRLTLQSWWSGNAYRVEEVRLANGTAWDADAITILANGGSLVPPPATEGPDSIFGTSLADTIDGLGGNDTIDGQNGNDVLIGGAGNDTLTGGAGADTLDGGIGNDALNGGTGNDVYRFGPGYGTDTINEFDSTAGNVDTIEIDAAPADVSVRRTGANLDLRLAGGDLLIATGWFANTAQRIEQVSFADGTVWDAATIEAMGNAGFAYVGTSAPDSLTGSEGPDTIEGLEGNDRLESLGGDDVILGGPGFDTLIGGAGSDMLFGGADGDSLAGDAGNDVLAGGAGGDFLQGGLGDDVYRYAPGDGTDLIVETGGADAVEFEAGIAPTEVSVSRAANDLLLTLGSGGSLRLTGWFAAAASRVETVRFADGTVWSEAFLANAARLSESGDFVRGSGGNDRLDALGGDDTVYGGPGNDELIGGAGDDLLGGEGGDDVLDGGPGRDILSGALGDDRYRFGTGSGDDWAIDNGGMDDVTFGAGLTPASVVFTRDLSNLYVTAGADKLTLVDWFYRPETRIEIFRFADGTTFEEAEVRRRIRAASGTSSADTIFGSDVNDSISGSIGEDSLYGEGGDDVLDGGQGSDYMLGGRGNDTYYVDNRLDRVTEDPEEGIDTVVTAASYTLGSNVENLTLSGAAAINGTGNSADNVMTGNTAANLLDGGAGNDSLLGGAGNDSYRFRRGDGSDEIIDVDATPGNFDEVGFAAEIAPSGVRISRVDDDIRLRVTGGGEILLRNWFDPVYRIESIRFADGTAWDAATIELLASLPANQPPVVAAPIEDQAATEDGAFIFSIPAGTFTDPDAGDALTYSARRADGSDLPVWISFDPASETFSGTPANDDVGVFEIAVTATDGSGESASDIFVLEVLNTNDAPVTADDAAAVGEDDSLGASGNVLSNDLDVDAGAVLAVANPGTYAAAYGALALAADGTFAYDLDNAAAQALRGGQVAAEVFDYVATDGIAQTPGTLRVTVTGANDAPAAADDDAAVHEDDLLVASGNVLANDADVDAGSVLTVTTAGTYAGAYGTLTLAADGAYVYSLDNMAAQSLAAGQTAVDGFGYAITDDDALPLAGGAQLAVRISGRNDAPVLGGTLPEKIGRELAPLVFVLPADSFADVDAGDALAYSASLEDGGPLPGWLAFDAQSGSFGGTPGIADGGEYSIRVTATDTAGASVSGSFNVTVVDSLLQGDCVIGTPDADVLNGTRADECFKGDGGDDLILAGAGNDYVDGGRGVDTLVGGTGDDLYVVDATFSGDDDGHGHGHESSGHGGGHDHHHDGHGNGDARGHRHDPFDHAVDAVTERPDEGYDAVVSYASYTLPENVEALRLAGDEDLEGRGNAADNVLVGNSGDNLLSGGTGSDLYLYEPGGGKDTIDEAGAVGELDVLRFAEGVSSEHARLKRRHDDLVVDLGGREGEVTMEDWFASGDNRVELIEFADGSGWDETQILERFAQRRHENGGWVDFEHGHPAQEEWCPVSAVDPLPAGPSGSEHDYDPAHLIADRLAGVPQHDFSALVAAYDAARLERVPEMTSEEIVRRWRAVAAHARALAAEEDEDARYAAPWLRNASAWMFAASPGSSSGFGFEASIGAARGPEGLRTFEGLREGLTRLE